MRDADAVDRLDLASRRLRQNRARKRQILDPRLSHDEVRAAIQHGITRLRHKALQKPFEDQNDGDDGRKRKPREHCAQRIQTKLTEDQSQPRRFRGESCRS